MKARLRRRVLGAAALLSLSAATATVPAAPLASGACRLVLTEHRSARLLAQAPMPTRELRVSFVHSVLGTPVEDRYAWRGDAWHLVEERFEGDGYGLPHAAAQGERLQRDGRAMRLLLDRRVSPLVILPLPSQQMRVSLADGRQWLLGELSDKSVELSAQGC